MHYMEAMPSTSRYSFLAASGLVMWMGLTTGCVGTRVRPASQTRDHAFITYKAPPKGSEELRLAVKDLIDIKGEVTSAGSRHLARNSPPAMSDAECLRLARQRGVRIVGKTNTTEFAVTMSGINSYFGTPRNYVKRGLIPGGSSSGSAAAVASGAADVAFGTDTAGSVRVPAACNGVLGLKTTYGLVSLKGVFPLSPKHLDTVGPLAKDMDHLVQGMDLLQEGFAGRYAAAVAARPSGRSIKVGRLYVEGTDPVVDKAVDDALIKAGFRVVVLDREFQAKWKEAQSAAETVAMADAWLNDEKYSNESGVSLITKAVIALGKVEYEMKYKAALERQRRWKRDMDRIFQRVDFIAMPTLQTQTPRMPFRGTTAVLEVQLLHRQNTASVNLAGVPALAVPIPLPAKGKKIPVTSLQLVGPRLSEAELLNAGRLVKASQ